MKKVLAILIVIAVLGVGGYLIDRSRAERQSLISGYFESQPSLASSRIGGRVVRILVQEGDRVAPGQPLVRLEADSYGATVESQQRAVDQAEQQYLEILRGARAEQVSKASSAVREAEANYERLRKGSRKEEVAAARAAANVALERLRQAERGLTTEERSQLQARVDAAAAAESLARKQLDRAEYLYNQGASPKQQFDTAQSGFAQAQAHRAEAEQALKRAREGTPREELAQSREAYRQALAQLDLVKSGPRPEEISAARARLDQARAALAELENGSRPEQIAGAKAAEEQARLQAKSLGENLKEKEIVAPSKGVIDRVLVAVGDLVQPGSPVVQISYPDDLWIRAYVPEIHLSKVRVGDDAELRVDGVDGVVKAIVERIASQGEFTPANLQSPEERGRQVFAVRLRLAQPDPRIKPGMAATIRRVGGWP